MARYRLPRGKAARATVAVSAGTGSMVVGCRLMETLLADLVRRHFGAHCAMSALGHSPTLSCMAGRTSTCSRYAYSTAHSTRVSGWPTAGQVHQKRRRATMTGNDTRRAAL